MPDHAASVKEIVRLFSRWQKDWDNKGDTAQAERWEKRVTALEAMLQENEDLRQKTKPIPASYGDLSDLPPELMKELTGIKVDELEEQIFTVVKAGGAEVDLDQVLIELFRRFGSIQTRKYLQNKLWRMAQKGLVFSVPNRKGLYSALPQPEVSRPDESPFRRVMNIDPFDTDDLDSDVPF
jgi:hypothetical protein